MLQLAGGAGGGLGSTGETETDGVTAERRGRRRAATDGPTGRERTATVRGRRGSGNPSLLRPVVVLGARPAPPSIALRKMEREGEKRRGGGGSGGGDE